MKIRTIAVAVLAARAASGQQPERATFYMLLAGDTIVVERTERSADRLRFQLFAVKQGSRLDLDAALTPTGLISRATQSAFANQSDTTPALRISVSFDGDSVGVERNGATNWIRVGRGALPNVNPSSALLEQALMRARQMGGDSASLTSFYLPSGPAVPMVVRWRGADSASVTFAGVTMLAAVDRTGRLLGASIPSQNARVIRGPATEGAVGGAKSYLAPPGAPYTAQAIRIRTRAGLTLNGTLTLPQGAAARPVPAVITISGSGPEDRDGTPPSLSKWHPFRQIADTLGRRGIAVLRLDDRGLGSDAGPSTATTADFAEDIRDAVAYLRTRPEIDGRRIGLIGHSEGGSIAPMVAGGDSSIAAVVIMGGIVSPGREILAFQQRFVVDSMAHLLGQQRDAALAQSKRATDSVAAALPWMRFFLDYDGAAMAARVTAPVLILHGEKDYQVPVAEAEKTASAIRRGGNRDVTVRTFPATNHLFLGDAGVGFSYEKLPTYDLSPAILGALADWLAARLTR
jgi:dienelactone hydrolase